MAEALLLEFVQQIFYISFFLEWLNQTYESNESIEKERRKLKDEEYLEKESRPQKKYYTSLGKLTKTEHKKTKGSSICSRYEVA